MGTYAFIAEALRYPAPGRIEILETGLLEMPKGAAKQALSEFLECIEELSLGEWEELHTHTLDLNPEVAPYLGYQLWGDSYKRGAFMARINREMQTLGIEKGGELPDHLVPILRYMDTAAPSAPVDTELLEVFEPAVQKMRKVLRKEDPDNPYLHLFEAILQVPQLQQS